MLFSTDEPIRRSAPPAGAQAEPFARLAAHVLAHKGWLAAAAIAGFLLTGVALCFVTPRYEAEAVVIVDSRRNKLADAESALSSIVLDQYQSALKSELELILSPDLARHVITSLGLLQTREYKTATAHVPTAARFASLRAALSADVGATLRWLGLHTATAEAPDEPMRASTSAGLQTRNAAPQEAAMQNAVRIFGKLFSATNDPKSLTIRMSYRSTSPQLAAAVTNAALQRYLADDEEVKAAAIDRSEAWLHGRIAGLRADLDAAERAVEDFRASHALATLRDRSPLQQDLLQLEGLQVDAQAQLAAAQAKIAQNHQDGGSDAVASGADALGSRVIQGLRAQQAALLVQQAQLSATLLPRHPSVIAVTGQLAQLNRTLGAEMSRIARSNDSDVRLAAMRLAAVTGQIQAVQGRIDTGNAADIRLRSLEADAASKRAVLDSFVQRYDQNAGTPLTPPDSRVVSWASVPVDASSPHYGLVLVGGTLGFAFAALALSVAIDRLRRGFDDLRELEAELGLLIAGLTPLLPRAARARRTIDGRTARPIRDLALTVRALAHRPAAVGPTGVVLVTSAVAGEGKSTLALALARSVAGAGQRCLLIDADIRNPSLHASLGLAAGPGLVDIVLDRTPIEAAARRAADENFDFLPAGRPVGDTLSPFTVEAFADGLATLKRLYDVIVIDSAPVLLAPEALVLLGSADLTLFIVKWRTTPREIARKAAELLTRCSARPCLAVLSQVDLRRMRQGGAWRMEERYRRAYQFS